MRYEVRFVEIDQIDLLDKTFQITTEPCNDTLIRSIEQIGVFHPPIVIEKNHTYYIVSGFRRVAACKALNQSHLWTWILHPDTSMAECAQIAIGDNSFQRSLNLIELSNAYHLLMNIFGELTIVAQQASLLNLSDNLTMISKLLKLKNLPIIIQKSLITGVIPLSIALDLLRFPEKEQLAFASIVNILQLSLNKQRELIGLCEEIAIRENISVMDVLLNQTVQSILNNDQADRNKKAKDLRSYLKKRRFPNLIQAELEFQEMIQSLQLDDRIHVTHPADFEGSEYNLQMSFQNITDLQTLREELDRIIKHPLLNKILMYPKKN